MFEKTLKMNNYGVYEYNNLVYLLIKERENVFLNILSNDLNLINKINIMKGEKAFLLNVNKNGCLLSIDDNLFLVVEGSVSNVLKCSDPRNVFWHLTEINNTYYVHEYGNSGYIYLSRSLDEWVKVVNNLEVDSSSRHFHNISYDPFRGWLLATLGDGCITRVIKSEDLGETWDPLYLGAWQFVPIVVLSDKIVFGMDSGIVRGGLGIYYPENDTWEFVYLKWLENGIRYSQMCDLKHIGDGIWVSALGTPQAIMASMDMKKWIPLFIEGYDPMFNHNMMVFVGSEHLYGLTGRSLFVFNKESIKKKLINDRYLMNEYDAVFDRIKGFGFTMKKRYLNSVCAIL